ncbi:hypothetical protein GS893_24395 [Rhodococcus hoagii]|nr:hypothetical protein [Prescottella equi]
MVGDLGGDRVELDADHLHSLGRRSQEMPATAARFEDAGALGQAGAFDGPPHRGRDRRIGVVRVDGAQTGGVVFAWGEQLLQFGTLGVELGLGGVEDLRDTAPPGPLGEYALFVRGGGPVLGDEAGDERERVQVCPGALLRRGGGQDVGTQCEVTTRLCRGRRCGRLGDGLGRGRRGGIGLTRSGDLFRILASIAGGGAGET